MKNRIPSSLVAVLAAFVLLLNLASCGSDAVDNATEPAVANSAVDSTTGEPLEAADHSDADHDDADHDDDGHVHEDEDHSDDDDGGEQVLQTGGNHSDDGVNLDLFVDGALVGEPTTAECELADGSTTACYQLTIAGFPVDGEVGPFCPRTTSDTADQTGIWLDGDSVYDLDGDFILNLAEIYGDDNWQLYDEDGNVRVTETLEAFEAAARPDVDPEYQNYCVEGRIEWLDNGEPIQSTVEIPAVPVASGSATPISGSIGVTLNGVTIDGSAPVDAILSAYTIAAFDDCGAHLNPVAGYHMHAATGCSEVGDAVEGETPIFGYALDGYAIHSALDSTTGLDECNGHTTDELGYHYHALPAEGNAVLSCFMGETVGSAAGGRAAGRPDGPPPTDTEAAAAPTDSAPTDSAPTESAPAGDDDHEHDGDDADHSHDETVAVGAFGGSYELVDEDFGTMVSVTVEGGVRTIVSNSLPDHDTGDFPNSGNPNTISEQSLVLEYLADPVYVGAAGFSQQPGIAINGVAFEPGTAETVTCASGETYRIEGLQDQYNLGMDFNNAHVQPTGQYHYHGVAELLVGNYDAGDDLVHVGFAADGFLIYYSQSGAYDSSYELSAAARTGSDCTASGPAGGSTIAIDGSAPDGTYNTDWMFSAGVGDLDSCNGVEIDGVYAYVLTDEYPFVPRCLNGEFTASGPGAGGGAPGGAASGDAGAGGAAPDFSEATAALGVTEQELLAALGGPPPDFAAAAEILGVTEEELRAVMPTPPGR